MGPLGVGLELGTGRRAARPGFDFAGALPAGASLARNSPGSRWTAAGVLVGEAADVARFDHDPATLTPRGLLIEGPATNLVAQASAFDAAAWTADAGGSGMPPVLIANAAPAPDGTAGADRIVFARGDGYSRIATSCPVETGPHVLSVWLRAATAGPSVALRIEGADSGTLAVDTAWRRFAFSTTLASGTAAVQFLLWSSVAEAPAMATVFAWGAQFETGGAPSSFVPTAGMAASRAADVMTLDWRSRGVAEGPATIRYTFDDGSTQDVATTIAGGTAAVPTNLARRWLARADRI